MNNTEIKACPICGKPPTVQYGRRAGNGEWVALPMVRCKPCDYQKHGNSDEEAVAKWNERAGGRQPATSEMAAAKHVGISELLDLLASATRLNEIVEGVRSERWVGDTRRRLKDTPEWCDFYVKTRRASESNDALCRPAGDAGGAQKELSK